MSVSQTIVFAHANGFPAGTYRLLFEAWRAAGFTVRAIDKLGHDAAFPVTSNWPHVRDELIAFITAGDAQQPVWLVGHSLGGLLGVLVASRRPELVAGLVMTAVFGVALAINCPGGLNPMFAISAAVYTAITPGAAFAAPVSIERILAWPRSARRNTP